MEKTYYYIKSVYTGGMSKVDHLPKFGGYEIVTEQEFYDWQIKTFGRIDYR